MKKKLLSLLALLMLCVGGAWAETVVTDPATEMVNGTYITLQCMDTNGGDEYYFNGNAVKSETRSFANIYKIVSNGADAFYLQRVSDSKYVGKSGDAVTMEDEASTAFTFSIATASNWTTYDNIKYTNGTSTVRFTTSGTFLNTQGKTVIPKYAAGTGGYSIWYVKTYTQNEVDKMNPALLTFSEVKDGYTYALVNVQPTNNVGKNYYLNSTNGNLTPVDATGFNNASEWPTTAQFVAIKQTDDKFAFKNVANNQYLAWKSHNGGENDKKGFVNTVELWSSWTLNASGRGAGFEGTFWPSCAKRASNVNGVGTLLIDNNGNWNAANTEWTTNAYSNTYGFVELAAPTTPEYTITFNFTGVAEGTLTATVREGIVPTLPVAIPSYVNYTVTPELTAVTGDATYTVNSSYQESYLPFEPNGDKFYTIKMNRNPKLNIYVDPADNTKIKTTSTASTDETRDYYQWNFGGDWLNGFSLKNKEVEKFVSYGEQGVNNTNNKKATLVEAVEPGATFDLEKSGNYFFLKIHGSTSNYISNNGGPGTTDLTTWNNRDYNDGGSQLIIEEAVDILTEAKNTAIAALPNHIPALYDYEAGVAAINAATSVEGVNTAKENYMKSAEGKKFFIKSTQGAKNYVDAGGETLDATSTTLKATGVYQLKYVESTNQYNLIVVKNNTYVKNNTATNAPSAITANEAEAGVFFIGNVNGNDNEVYFTKVLSGWNAIHYNSNYTGHNCVWTYDAGASQWTIESISDEQWADMNPTYDWDAFENLLTQINALTFGDKLGQYDNKEVPEYSAPITDFIGYFNGDFENKDESIYNEDMEVMQWILANLQLNLPKAGMFVTIKGKTSGKYIHNDDTIGAMVTLGENNDETAIYYVEENLKLVNYSNGLYMAGSTQVAVGGTADTYTFSEGDAKGNYYIKPSSKNYLVDWTDGKANYWSTPATAGGRCNWVIEEVETLPVVIGTTGYATLYAPVAIETPDNVKAYVLAENGDYLTATEVSTIPANTGVILQRQSQENGDTYGFHITTGGSAESCLSGTVATIAKPEASIYTLANGENGLGFYNYTGTTLKGFRAFYEAPAGARGFVIDFGGETGVVNVDVNADANEGKIYNLAGQRVSKAEKGIYIINGKKVLK